MKSIFPAIATAAACLLSLFPNHALAFYNSQTGRWLSRDPIEEQGGVNVSTFCWNSPGSYFDANGFQPFMLAPSTVVGRIGTLSEFSEVSEPMVRIAGSPGETITGTSRPIPQQIPDVVMRPVGPGLRPPVAVTVPQPAPQPQTQQNPTEKPVGQPITEKQRNEDEYLYRAMLQEFFGGKPQIGENKKMLGVMISGTDPDIVPATKGGELWVNPEGPNNNNPSIIQIKGMSVTRVGPTFGPPWRTPVEYGGTEKKVKMFRIRTLDVISDPRLGFHPDDIYHGVIHPSKCMPYREYKNALESTRPKWEQIIPTKPKQFVPTLI